MKEKEAPLPYLSPSSRSISHQFLRSLHILVLEPGTGYCGVELHYAYRSGLEMLLLLLLAVIRLHRKLGFGPL